MERLLNVNPQDFLDWKLNDTIESLNDPEGELWQWVMVGMFEWKSPEDAAAARDRCAAWLKRKGVAPANLKQYTTPPDEISRRPSLTADAS